MDQATWQSWREKLELFDAFGRTDFATEEREGTRLKRRFMEFCAPRGRVLDLGCGTGFNQRFLSAGTAYVGIDPLRLAGAYAFPFVQAVGEYLPWRSGVFDAALCIATLDHVADPALLFGEARRVLRPGGTLGVMTKVEFEGGFGARAALYVRVGVRKLTHGNLAGLRRGLREVLTGAEDEFHMHHFTRTSLAALCADGFVDVTLESIGNVAFLRARARGPADA